MHKKLMSCFIASTLAFSSSGIAEEQATIPAVEQVEHTEPAETPAASKPREVGPASDAPARAARKKKWQNIGIACLAVVTAGLGIYFASTNGGHSAH